MKKISSIFILLWPLLTEAQESIMKISGGVKLGTGISMLNQRPALGPGFKVQNSAIQVFIIGGRLTVPLRKKLLFLSEICLGGKGGAYTLSYVDSSYYRNPDKVINRASTTSFLFHLAWRSRAHTNTFFWGGGPGIDIENNFMNGKKMSGCINILAGYRFFPGFSAEFSARRDVFRLKEEDPYGIITSPSTVLAISLAYDF